jgi:bacteriophage N4 adsorption protein B
VIPLSTPLKEWTHGLYIDDFVEWQSRDMPVRLDMGSFVPSAGVGTAYSRKALQALARDRENCIFEPSALTEDYENGIRLHELGFRQAFVPLRKDRLGDWTATREYFPTSVQTAIKQRSRWATGIMLQAWERHAWRGTWPVKYWLWRDRKGLIGHPISALSNVISIYGLATWLWSFASGQDWLLGKLSRQATSEVWTSWGVWAVAAMLLYRIGFRAFHTGRIYNWKVALGVPLRMILGNYINLMATGKAVYRFAKYKWNGQPLVWLKTAHQYPNRAALTAPRWGLMETLQVLGALPSNSTPHRRSENDFVLGESLVREGIISERQLYEAISMQQGIALSDGPQGPQRLGKILPLQLIQRWKVIPSQLQDGSLEVLSPELPDPEAVRDLERHSGVKVHFALLPPAAFQRELLRLEASIKGI